MTDLEAEQILARLSIVEQKLQDLENALHVQGQPVELNSVTKSGKPIIATDHPLIIRVEGVRGGEPVTRHAYVSVRAIIERTRLGETPEQIRQGYAPYLSLAEISDALSYYLHHSAEIDGYIADNQAAWERAAELSRLADERKRTTRKI